MKFFLTLIIATILISFDVSAQKIVKSIKSSVTKEGLESKLRFLASDELKGRDVGSPEIDIAALYIAEAFRSYGLQVPPGKDSYYQEVKLVKKTKADSAFLTVGDETAENKKDIMFLDGTDGTYEAEIVFLNYGLEEDYEGMDVNGRIVMVLPGNENTESPTQYRSISAQKRNLARKNGAIGVVELYKSRSLPWTLASSMLSRPGLSLDYSGDEDNSVFLAWLSDPQGTWENKVREGQQTASVHIGGISKINVGGKNVIGWIEGKDPKKNQEYMVMTAHYDHVGVRPRDNGQDSIYNGARDNAIGVATLLETARFFSANKPAYSVVFIALTAEEKGLLGSRWYVEKPLFPLEKTFFNFNTDGGGYNDTTIATVIGLNRTTVTANLKKSVQPFGLGITDDPVPEQNLFDRSDNVSFAKKGIPALTFSCGITAFDAEIMKYYHQAADEVPSLDMDYITQYSRSFVYAAYLIANSKVKPFWNKGDKYEETGLELYDMSN